MAKRRPFGDGMVRKRDDGRWEGRIVIGHKENGDPESISTDFFERLLEVSRIKIEALKKRPFLIQFLYSAFGETDPEVYDELKVYFSAGDVMRNEMMILNTDGTYQELDSSFYYTDDDGIIHLENLDTGWYKIVELEPAAGYMLKDPSEQIIYVEHDKAVEVTFENIPKSALVIRKIDAATGAPLANAWFRVRYLGGTSGSGGTIIGEYATSSNGNIIIDDSQVH